MLQEDAHEEDAQWDFQQTTEKHDLNNNNGIADAEHARQHQLGKFYTYAQYLGEWIPFTTNRGVQRG